MARRTGSRGQKKAPLYDLSKQALKPEQKEQFAKELIGESDRAAALVACAELEIYLTHLLMFKFPIPAKERDELFFGRNAPISDLATKIAIAYGLGLIYADERDDLNCIRRIRNAFAHAVISLTFENDLIADLCSRLHYRDVYGDESGSVDQPKFRYLITALSLRKIFFDRGFDLVADSVKKYENADELLAEINSLKMRDT
jgi:hypothetical protein